MSINKSMKLITINNTGMHACIFFYVVVEVNDARLHLFDQYDYIRCKNCQKKLVPLKLSSRKWHGRVISD